MPRFTLIALALAASSIPAPGSTAVGQDGVSLNPFGGAIRFAPHMPETVGAEHPFAGRVEVVPIIDMPPRVGGFLNTFVREREMNEALRASVAAAGLAAEARPEFRLVITWLDFDSPFRISTSSNATASLRYELQRVDTGEPIFRRDVRTSARSSGGNAAERQRGTVRATLAANIAGGLWCLEQSPLGRAPLDCATSPVGRFAAPIIVTTPIYR